MSKVDYGDSDRHFHMLVTGMTKCGKTYALLEILEREYKGYFDYIVILCPTLTDNKTYMNWKYRFDSDVIGVKCDQDEMEEMLYVIMKSYHKCNALIIVDDCAASKGVTNRTGNLAKLAFSGRHSLISSVFLTQHLTSVVKPYRSNVSRLIAFYPPNATDMKVITDSYMNGVPKSEVSDIVETLKTVKYAYLDVTLESPYTFKIVLPSELAKVSLDSV